MQIMSPNIWKKSTSRNVLNPWHHCLKHTSMLYLIGTIHLKQYKNYQKISSDNNTKNDTSCINNKISLPF